MFLEKHKIQKGVFKLGGEVVDGSPPPHISKSFHVLSECPCSLPNPSLIQDFIMDSGSGVDLSSLSGPTRQQKGLKVLGYQSFFDGLCVLETTFNHLSLK